MDTNPKDPDPDESSGREQPRFRKSGCGATSYFESPFSSIISKSSVLNRGRGPKVPDSNPEADKLYSRLDNLRERSPKGRPTNFDIADVRTTAFDSHRKTSNPAKSNVSPPVLRSKMLSTTLPSSYRVSDRPLSQLLPSPVGQTQQESSEKSTSESPHHTFGLKTASYNPQMDANGQLLSEKLPKSPSVEKASLFDSLNSRPLQSGSGGQLIPDRSPTQPRSSSSPLSDSGFEEFKALHSRMVKPEGRYAFKASRQLSTSLTTLDSEPSSSGTVRKSEPSKRHSAILSYGTPRTVTSGGSSPSRSPTVSRGKFDLSSSPYVDDFDVKQCATDKGHQNVFLQKYLTNANRKFSETEKSRKNTLPVIRSEKASLRKSDTDLTNPSLSTTCYDAKGISEWTKLPRKSNSQESYEESSRKKVHFQTTPSVPIRSLSDSEKATSPPAKYDKWSFKTVDQISPQINKNKTTELPGNNSNNICQEFNVKNDLRYEANSRDCETPFLKEKNTQSQEKISDCKSKIIKSQDQNIFGSMADSAESKEKSESSKPLQPPLDKTAGLFKNSSNEMGCLKSSHLSSKLDRDTDIPKNTANFDPSNKGYSKVISEFKANMASDATSKNKNQTNIQNVDSARSDDKSRVKKVSFGSSEDNDYSKYPLVLSDRSMVKFQDEKDEDEDVQPNWEISNLSDYKLVEGEDSNLMDFERMMNFKTNRSKMMGSSIKDFERGQSSFSGLSQIGTFSAGFQQERSDRSKIDAFSAECQKEQKTSKFSYSNVESNTPKEEPVPSSRDGRISAFKSCKKCSSSFDSAEFRDSFENGGNWKRSIAEEEPIMSGSFPKGSGFKDFSSSGTLFGEKVNQENRVYSEVSSKSSAFRTEQTQRSIILNRKVSSTVTRRLRIGRTVKTTSRYTRQVNIFLYLFKIKQKFYSILQNTAKNCI